MDSHHRAQHARPALPSWDTFLSDPAAWARSMGFTPDIIEQMPEVPGIAPPHARLQEEPPHITWGSLLSGDRSPAQCVAFIDNLITTASAKHAQVCAKHLCSLRQARLQLLRDGDVSAWARKMRPAQPASSSYSPDWVTTPDRRKVRPTTTAQVLLGPQQDWNRLLQEPSCSWAHPVVLPFRPTHHCLTKPRGALNLAVLAQAVNHPETVNLANAFLAPGPWLISLSPHAVTPISDQRLIAGSWVLTVERDCWFATRPAPCPGPRLKVIALGDTPYMHLTMDHFTRNSNQGPLILRAQEKPDYTLVRPVSPEEQQFLLAKFRPSRPGPSGWKVCYIEAFPPDVQQLYWQCLDLLRMIGTVPPSLQHATQIHLPKPSGGWRPLSMLEESFKAVEAVVASRLAVQRDPWHSDAPFSRFNRAYSKGVAAAPEVLCLDCLVCEDAQRSGRPLLHVPADYEKFFNILQLAEVDALQQGRGVPDSVRRLHHAMFSNMRAQLSTRSGLTPPFACCSWRASRRCLVTGSVPCRPRPLVAPPRRGWCRLHH